MSLSNNKYCELILNWNSIPYYDHKIGYDSFTSAIIKYIESIIDRKTLKGSAEQ